MRGQVATDRAVARAPYAFGVCLVAVCVLWTPNVAQAQGEEPATSSAARGAGEQRTLEATEGDPRGVIIRLNDEGILKATLADDEILIDTRYGLLRVAANDVQRIEFALRLSEHQRSRIDHAIEQLDSPHEETQSAAAKQLQALGHLAWPALSRAAKKADSRAGREATRILEELPETIDAKDLGPREMDVIHTADSVIAGRLAAAELRLDTAQFGALSLRIADARRLRHQGLAEEKPTEEEEEVSPAPPSLTAFHGQVGQTLRFRVAGDVTGTVWGTDVYTTDSSLAAAAVHAGALRTGQTGIVRVKILPAPPSFGGSDRHGVSSHSYGPYPMAFRFLGKAKR